MLGYASMGGVIMHAVPFEVVSIRGGLRRSADQGENPVCRITEKVCTFG